MVFEGGRDGSVPATAWGIWPMQVRITPGYRLRFLCKPRPRVGLVGSRQTCVRRRQGPGWHNDPPDLAELNGFIRGQFEINETKDRHDHQPLSPGNGGDERADRGNGAGQRRLDRPTSEHR